MLNTGQMQFDFSFHNTIREVERREEFEASAKSQEEVIYELFCFKKLEMAWFEVQSFLPEMNRESLKRSLTNLKNKGKLIKTDIRVIGTQGKNCYKYKLR